MVTVGAALAAAAAGAAWAAPAAIVTAMAVDAKRLRLRILDILPFSAYFSDAI